MEPLGKPLNNPKAASLKPEPRLAGTVSTDLSPPQLLAETPTGCRRGFFFVGSCRAQVFFFLMGPFPSALASETPNLREPV